MEWCTRLSGLDNFRIDHSDFASLNKYNFFLHLNAPNFGCCCCCRLKSQAKSVKEKMLFKNKKCVQYPFCIHLCNVSVCMSSSTRRNCAGNIFSPYLLTKMGTFWFLFIRVTLERNLYERCFSSMLIKKNKK